MTMLLTFEIFGRARRNHRKKFLKLCQTSFSGIVHSEPMWLTFLSFDPFLHAYFQSTADACTYVRLTSRLHNARVPPKSEILDNCLVGYR